ncbi:MAG: hypothetical protein IT326_02500 [Anaerolineae bacterium]|nr:hypothetical protein [Anaerolineae bacterium]
MAHTFSITSLPTLDRYFFEGEPAPYVLLGSCGIFTSVMLATLGADVFYSGPHGDGFDEALTAPIRAAGVRIELFHLPGPRATLELRFNAAGEMAFFERIRGIEANFTAEHLPPAFWEGAIYWVGTCPTQVQQAVARRGKSQGTPVCLTTQKKYTGRLDSLLEVTPYLSTLFTNNTEARTWSRSEAGDASLHSVLERLRESSPGLRIVITRGARGAWLIEGEDFYSVPAAPVSELRYSIGAGDTFAANLAYALHTGLPVETALRRAVTAAAIKMRAVGYFEPPRPEEIDASLDRHGADLTVQHTTWGSPTAAGWINGEESAS